MTGSRSAKEQRLFHLAPQVLQYLYARDGCSKVHRLSHSSEGMRDDFGIDVFAILGRTVMGGWWLRRVEPHHSPSG